MIKDILQNRIGQLALLQSLLFAFSEFFMWSNNSHMFSVEQIVYSSITVIGISIILFFITYYLGKIFLHFFKFKYAELIYAVLITILACFIANLFFARNVFYPNHHFVFAILVSIILLFYIINKLSKLIIFVGFLCCFSIIMISKNMIYDFNQTKKISSSLDNNDYLTKLDLIKLKTTPNIYLFWLESYHGLNIMKDIFSIDVTKLQSFLEKNHFKIYPNTYSDSSFTLASFIDVFSMGNISSADTTRGLSDSIALIRDVIGGNEYNYPLKILKNNNYMTWMAFRENYDYYFKTMGRNLDYSNIVYDKDNFFYKIIPTIRFIKYYDTISNSSFVERNYRLRDDFPIEFPEQIKIIINKSKEEGKPFFVSLKGGANHAAPAMDSKDSQKWINSQYYQNLVYKSNDEIYEIVDYIVNNDPNSIIILIGDHGSMFSGVDDNLSNENIDELICKSYYDVLLAVRLPNGEQYDFTHEKYLSHKNLFLHIFAYLSDDWNLLEYRKPSQIIDGNNKIIIDEGKVMNQK